MLWIIFLCLTAAVLLALLRPLFGGGGEEPGRDAANAQVYRDQLKEIDSDRDRGLIGEAEAKAARLEIERRLLATMDADQNVAAARSGSPVWMAVAVAVALPLIVLGFYLTYGSPQLPDQPLLVRLQQPVDEQNVAELIARVEAGLKRKPNDGQGWAVIAPVYISVRRFDQGLEAYRKAIRLLGPRPDLLAGYGEALVFANDGAVDPQAREILERAVADDPTLVKPRILLAYSDEQAGNYQRAVARWRELKSLVKNDERWAPLVERRIASAEAKLDGSSPPKGPVRQSAGGPNAGDVEAAQNMSPDARKQMIETMVGRLAQRLEQNGDDLDGWLKLVRSYAVLDRKDDARTALAKAKAQFSDQPAALQRLNSLASELGISS
ncbi:Formate-dependent nitrite reductase complex subunit NrfG [Methyloligella halotolerans]|uniref:Formate-dependent nitrite reductase complex subunit NrfG n=1 Tax=Methyloligella halotolerans TaxID=1177755 RepID=A0A1E2RX57_9HYPH|nr:c-type cytochrome biogenesis protein CcmI [Methyloligella halotolerans]ODA66826.1 Formate-dependent nitrite reductase complex subunit NrfG [Methyloligella halotolerans]